MIPEAFCLKNFFAKTPEWLDKKIFESVASLESSSDEEEMTYVQFKLLTVKTNGKIVKVLQIMDVSSQVLYHAARN